jgi:hypothetical protein
LTRNAEVNGVRIEGYVFHSRRERLSIRLTEALNNILKALLDVPPPKRCEAEVPVFLKIR